MQLMNYITHSDDWEQRADKVLSHFNYRQPDEIDIYDICWRYGIIIKPLEYDFVNNDIEFETIKHLKAFSVPKQKGKRGTIYLRPTLDGLEKKLILAEEFCHIYSHFSSQLIMDKYSINKIENQARRMSAYLLMPWKFVSKLLNLQVDQSILISEIADLFLVTEEFAYYRLELAFQHRVDAISNFRGKIRALEVL